MLRLSRLLDAVRELKEKFPFGQWLGATALSGMMFVQSDEDTQLLHIRGANPSSGTKILCATPGPSSSMLFLYLLRCERSTTAMQASLWGPGTSFLQRNFLTSSHRRSPSALCFSARYVYSNMTVMVDADCMRLDHNRETAV